MSIEEIVDLAREHGEESEPDMEVGDLQQALRIAWRLIPANKRAEALRQIKRDVFGEED